MKAVKDMAFVATILVVSFLVWLVMSATWSAEDCSEHGCRWLMESALTFYAAPIIGMALIAFIYWLLGIDKE